MRSKITIPNPCSKKWGELSGKSSKRFCRTCSKHVHDFTKMENEEVIQFLKMRKGGVCGVFTKTQVQQLSFKEKVKHSVRRHKKNPLKLSSVLVAIVFFTMINFFSSCVQKTMGEIVPHNTEYVSSCNSQNHPSDTIPKCDSVKSIDYMLGEVEFVKEDSTSQQEELLMGKFHIPDANIKED